MIGHHAERIYVFLCLGAMLVMLYALQQYELGIWNLFPVIVSSIAVIVRWKLGPTMLILIVTALLVSARIQNYRIADAVEPAAFSDFLLSLSVLVFTIGHYRLQTMHSLSTAHSPPHRLTKGLPELAIVILTAAVCAGWAQVLGGWFLSENTWLGLPPRLWQFMVLIWILGSAFMVFAGMLGLLHQRRMSPLQASSLLQDTVWAETCRPQRTINSQLAWAWLRQQRKGKQ